MIRAFVFSFTFIFFSNYIFSQDYLDQIQNNLSNTSLDFPLDSVLKYRYNYYHLNFNFHDEFVKGTFNECMKNIDNTGFLDSIIIRNNVGKVFGAFNVYIGESVPYKVSQEVISFYMDKNLEGFKIILIKNSPYKYDHKRHQKRNIIIRGGHCPYSFLRRYVSKGESLQQLLGAKSQASFISIFDQVDERKREYLEKIKIIENTKVRFSGCEEIESIEDRMRCSDNKLDLWIEEHIANSIEFEPVKRHHNNMVLYIDETGKVYDLRCSKYVDSAKKEEFKKIFLTMPLWIAPTENGIKRKSIKTVFLDYSPVN